MEKPLQKGESESRLGVRNIRHDFSDSLRRGRDQRLLNEIAALVVKEPRPVLGIWGDNKSALIEFSFAWEVVDRSATNSTNRASIRDWEQWM